MLIKYVLDKSVVFRAQLYQWFIATILYLAIFYCLLKKTFFCIRPIMKKYIKHTYYILNLCNIVENIQS